MKAKKLPLVEVIWTDCQLIVGGWEPHSDAMRARRPRNLRQRSVGYVLAEDNKGIMLASSLSVSGNVFGAVIIPAGQISSRRKLR